MNELSRRCKRCGYWIYEGSTRCTGCQMDLTDTQEVRPFVLRRTSFITVTGYGNLLGGATYLVTGLTVALVTLRPPKMTKEMTAQLRELRDMPHFDLFIAFSLVYGIVAFATGIGLLSLRPWGRWLQVGLSVLGLPQVPSGTLWAFMEMIYFLDPTVSLLFERKALDELSDTELDSLRILRLKDGQAIWVGILMGATTLGIAVIGGLLIASLVQGKSYLPIATE